MTASLGIRVICSSLVDWRSMKKECRHARHNKHEIFLYFFCRNRNLMVPRDRNTRFFKIVFVSAEMFDFKTFPSMLSVRWNPFRVCSVWDKIRSVYAQCTMKFVPRMLSMDVHVKTVHILPLAEYARKFDPRMLSVRWNHFHVCPACACYNFRKLLRNTKLKCKCWL
jgi:hypothetical protein